MTRLWLCLGVASGLVPSLHRHTAVERHAGRQLSVQHPALVFQARRRVNHDLTGLRRGVVLRSDRGQEVIAADDPLVKRVEAEVRPLMKLPGRRRRRKTGGGGDGRQRLGLLAQPRQAAQHRARPRRPPKSRRPARARAPSFASEDAPRDDLVICRELCRPGEDDAELFAMISKKEAVAYVEKRSVMRDWLKALFRGQAYATIGLGLVASNDAIPGVHLDLSLQVLGFWGWWLFTVPSLRSIKPLPAPEKKALDAAFLATLVASLAAPFATKDPAQIWWIDAGVVAVSF